MDKSQLSRFHICHIYARMHTSHYNNSGNLGKTYYDVVDNDDIDAVEVAPELFKREQEQEVTHP